MRITKRLGVITVTAVALAGLVACGDSDDDGGGGASGTSTTLEETPIRGGSLIYGINASTGILNPAVTTNGGVHTNSEAMFNGLLAYSKTDEIVGDLADRFTISQDGKTADFTLRTGMTWHDGKPITAADVDFTWREALLRYHSRTASSVGPALGVTGSGNGATTPPGAITMPDGPTGLRVQFNFQTPYFPLFRQMNVTEAPIIPKHVYESCSTLAMGNGATLGNTAGSVCEANNNPVGSGPFKFTSRDSTKIEVARNPTYFKRDLPHLDRIVLLVVTNVDDALRAARATGGSVDVGTVTNASVREFSTKPEYNAVQVTRGTGGSNCVLTIGYNLWPKGMSASTINAKAPDAPYEHPIFKDPAVRSALFTATDRTGMWQKIEFEQGKVATSAYSSKLPGYEALKLPGDDGRGNDADIAAAKAELDRAGWVDSNGNGTRDKGGVELSFDIIGFDTGTQPEYGRAFAADMAKINVSVNVRPLTTAAVNQALIDRDYDSSLVSYCNGDTAVVGVKRAYASSDIRAAAFSNIAGYRQTSMDMLWNRVVATAGTQEQTVNRDIQQQAVTNLPYVWINETVSTRVTRSVCKGYNHNNTGLFVESAYCSQ
ncbi:MAG: ABC transporter substrate-binding protein [Acidimicrobiales bacterium]